MWRAFFLAIGIFLIVLGTECLVMDRFVMAGETNQEVVNPYANSFQPQPQGAREIIPPEWAPWSMLSTGAVVILYSLTLNRGGP